MRLTRIYQMALLIAVALFVLAVRPSSVNAQADSYFAEYFNNITLSGPPAATQTVGVIDLFDSDLPPLGVNADNFSARYTAQLAFVNGFHEFALQGSGGIRLYVDDVLVIDRWTTGAKSVSYVQMMTAGTHKVVVEFYSTTGFGYLSMAVIGFQGNINGRVLAANGVTPIVGATVEVYRNTNSVYGLLTTATTNASGNFSLTGVQGNFKFRAVAPGWVEDYYENQTSLAAANNAVLTRNGTLNNINFSLDLAATLAGAATFEGRPEAPHASYVQQLAVRLTRTGAPMIEEVVNTNDLGEFMFVGLVPGNYTMRVKGTHTLAVSSAITLASDENFISTPTLPEGDANDDNSVNITDFSLLAASFGLTSSAPLFDARADFNGDTVVNINDFSLLASHFGQTGAPAA